MSHRSQIMLFVLGVALLSPAVHTASAQTGAIDGEQKIRALIAAGDLDKLYTDDIYFVSGAFPNPLKGLSALRQSSSGVAAKRTGEKHEEHPERIVVAPTGDMAYEYGTGHISFTRPGGEQVSFDLTYLRVWRKDNGQWRIAAVDFRPQQP